MKPGKDSRKKPRAVWRPLMLGLPVAGLLAAAGCERAELPWVVPGDRTLGVVTPPGRDDTLGGDLTNFVEHTRSSISDP